MDFTPDEAAGAVAEAAEEVFARAEPVWTDRFDSDGGYDSALWHALVEAGLTGLPLPEAHGGDGLAGADVLPLIRRMGQAAAVTPALDAVIAGLTLAAATGTASGPGVAEAAELIADGRAVAVAHREPTDGPAVTAVADGDELLISGTKTGVLHAETADLLLVSTDAGTVSVDRRADGVTIVRTPASSGWGECTVAFDGAPGRLIDPDPAPLDRYRRLVLGGYADGLVAGATRLTADHVSTRHQFGRPIALFQAVGQQLADIYVINRTMNLAITSAGWRLAQGLDAESDLAIATWWLADELPATLRTMTHLHGGIGVDLGYPLHRYFSLAKDLARLVGGPTATLDELADLPRG